MIFSNDANISVSEAMDVILPNSIHHTANSFGVPFCYNNGISGCEEYFYDFKSGDYCLINNFPKWFSAELRELVIKKKKAQKSYMETDTTSDRDKFRLLNDKCIEIRKTCYESFVNKIEDNINENPRSFWTFVNEKRKDFVLPQRVENENVVSSYNDELVDLFARFFLLSIRYRIIITLNIVLIIL